MTATTDETTHGTDSAKVYLTTTELARRWGMKKATLRNWRFKKIGPRYFKPAGARGKALYSIEDVVAYEKRHTTNGETPHERDEATETAPQR